MKLPLDAEKLIPHRKPMRLIDRLHECDGDSATASARFAPDSPFVADDNGTVERVALLELIAQTYAASKAYQDLADGKSPLQGYLVGIRKAVFHNDAYVEQDLIVRIVAKEAFNGFYVASGEVWHAHSMLLQATLKVWIDSENTREG